MVMLRLAAAETVSEPLEVIRKSSEIGEEVSIL
jgi:hypothetical protein